MKAIIIAGGMGTRLRPLTYNTPKPIVSLANRPFILHQIDLLRKFGITDIILNLHYLSDNIKNIFEDESKMGVKISYSMENDPLGTCGAVKNAEEFFDDKPMLVFNGDILTDINLGKMIQFHEEKKAKVTIALTHVENPTIYGLVITDKDSRVLEFREKPTWEQVVVNTVNAGIYIVDPSIFKEVPKGKPYSFERQLYPSLLEQKERVFGFNTDAYWMDIGDPAKYLQAHHDILNGYVMANIPGNKVESNVWIGTGANISKSAKIRGNVLLGNNCTIAEEVVLEESVTLGDGVSVAKGSKLKNCVIHGQTKLGEGVHIDGAIVGSNCTIEDYSIIGNGVVLADGTIIQKGTKAGVVL